MNLRLEGFVNEGVVKKIYQFVSTALLAILPIVALAQAAAAESASQFPSKPVRLIVPFPAGGGADVIARVIAEGLTERLGQSVYIDYRSGANGNIGMEFVANAPADGYTMIIATSNTWAVNPTIYKASFDVVKDFAPIIQVTSSPGILVVNPNQPVKSVQELIALAKAQPGKIDYGSAGMGSFGHLCGVIFEQMSGTKMTHIPYKGSAPATLDAISGQIPLLFNDALATLPYLQSGMLRGLAVTSIKRMPMFPDLPTLDEAGLKGYDNSTWTAIAVPAATPKDIVAKLNREMAAVLSMSRTQEKIAAAGAITVGGTPEQFAAFLNAEIVKFRRIIKEAQITAQ
jgi:tripartite-type tricarboxylate transporter receptor subunit TctC